MYLHSHIIDITYLSGGKISHDTVAIPKVSGQRWGIHVAYGGQDLADISCPHSLALSLALMDLAASLFLGTDLVQSPNLDLTYRYK